MKKDICAYTYEQLAAEMEQIGEKKFRAKQIYEWLHDESLQSAPGKTGGGI